MTALSLRLRSRRLQSSLYELTLGVTFTICFGLFSFLFSSFRGKPENFSHLSVLVVGVIFGVYMAYDYERKKKKHDLTDWENL